MILLVNNRKLCTRQKRVRYAEWYLMHDKSANAPYYFGAWLINRELFDSQIASFIDFLAGLLIAI